jgi:hypothetical protein
MKNWKERVSDTVEIEGLISYVEDRPALSNPMRPVVHVFRVPGEPVLTFHVLFLWTDTLSVPLDLRDMHADGLKLRRL